MLSNKNQNWDNVIYLITYEIFHNRHRKQRKTIGKNVVLSMPFLFQGRSFSIQTSLKIFVVRIYDTGITVFSIQQLNLFADLQYDHSKG